ncbi:MAG: hypothetical protein IKR18_05515 [Bacteroidaceae bacterium]|nr:hypothetical protein [Bacteroidaceae bacterium]
MIDNPSDKGEELIAPLIDYVPEQTDDNVSESEQNVTSPLNDKLNSASWIKHPSGFEYPEFFRKTEYSVDEVPADVEVYSYEDIKMCYWPFLGNWSLEDFEEGTYISNTEKIKKVTYKDSSGDIYSGYTGNGDIFYLKRVVIPDEVLHGRILALIYPSSYSGDKGVDKLIGIVRKMKYKSE